MKKSVVLAAVLTLFAATSALAEHKSADHAASEQRLLVTDVPDPGQVEARLDYIYSKADGKNELDEKISDEKSVGNLFLGAGVVKGLKLYASLPYTFVQHEEGEKIEGLGDLTLGARYAITKELVHLPMDVALGMEWQLYSANASADKPGSGANTYSPYVAVSKHYGMATPYFKYQPDFVNSKNDDWVDHNITVGDEIEFCNRMSLDASVKTIVNGSRDDIKSSTDVEIELMPYINIAKNTYLLPRVAYKFIGDIKNRAGEKIVKDADEITTGIGIYILF